MRREPTAVPRTEQGRGGKVGFASDVFSLGVIICFAATGKETWGTGSAEEMLDRVAQEPPGLTGLPADLIFFAARAGTLPQLFTAPGGTCNHLPPVLGSSDVPKFADNTDLQKIVPEYGSQLYYLSFAPAKESGCRTHAHPFQKDPMCSFLAYYRAQSATGNPGVDGVDVMRELDSGKIAFDGASGRISFSARNHAPPNHPVYMTLLGRTLTLQVSGGQFSGSRAEEGGSCPTVP